MVIYILSLAMSLITLQGSKDIRIKNNKIAPPGTVWVKDSLYVDKTEITNVSYREYLFSLYNNYGKESKQYLEALPDTTVWSKKLISNEPYVSLYLRHPAYASYPVVGVSYEQAVAYCEWRTKQVNLSIYLKLNKMDYSEIGKIKANIPVYVKYRLPSKNEWEYFAKAGIEKKMYATENNSLYDNKGNARFNFFQISEKSIYFNDTTKTYQIKDFIDHHIVDNYLLTSSVGALNSNHEWGIFDLCGNVKEMVSEKGLAKGGSFILPAYNCRIDQNQYYDKPMFDLGFRCVCEVLVGYK